MLKKELAVNVNIERSIGGIRQQGEWRSGLKGLEEVSEVARDDRPDESGNRHVTLSKAQLIWEEGIDRLSH
jgi:hypothetical protein